MNIYTDNEYKILALNKEPRSYKYCFVTTLSREVIFGNWCDACITGYKYMLNYEMLFNEDGSNKRDSVTGELVFNLDTEGNKIPAGYSCYPYIDYHTLLLIQKQYEESQKQIQTLNAQIEYLTMASGGEMKVGRE